MNYKIIILIVGVCITLGCSNNNKKSQTTKIDVDSIKSLILDKENATLDRWYNADPMGFIDNSWDDVTYFDPSLINRVDSIDAFRDFLTPIIGKVHVPIHKFDKPLVQVFGDIAILTFTDVFAVDTVTFRWHATEVYHCRENEWKLIHTHWTKSEIK
ncbi:MAG: nuclear transport factor 2 family protein [Bacteroidales bacterium]|nr:nuclear transport factor 2 family protein [Bacteroidales bacterium]